MVAIYLTQRAQRTRCFNLPAVHAVAGVVASFTTTGERRGRVTNEYSKQPLLFRQPLRPLVARSQRPLQSKCCLIKSLRPLRPLRAKQNIRMVAIISRKERREHREGRNIWHCLCYKRIFHIFVVTINDNIV